MIENLKSWLANYYKIDLSEVEPYFKNENVTGFLVIWTIFEQKLFNGFVKFGDLKTYSNAQVQKMGRFTRY